ncbi:MAG TPA: DUF4160 domain-containing protein [Verrucomicrobiota bacterium]|nr:DUF4160 domain-containing protein [Verrucomicrobiota bacterium]
MPVLSKFYGIVIRMVFSRALGAHFHALYGDREVVVGLHPLRIIQGDAPPRVADLVLEWGALHHRELMQAWQRLGQARPPEPIAPLN